MLARHPSLHSVIVECGAGWLPWVLYTMDDQYERKHMWIEPKLDMKPSEYFKRQGHATFSDDLAALRMIDFIGPEALLWGSDYPSRRRHVPPLPGGDREDLRRAL